jgi:hypothetical protein
LSNLIERFTELEKSVQGGGRCEHGKRADAQERQE